MIFHTTQLTNTRNIQFSVIILYYLSAKCCVQSESSIQVLSRVLVKNIFSLNFSVHQMMRRMPWPSALRALIPRILFCCCPMSRQCFLHCHRAEHSSSRPACRPRLVNRFRDCRIYLEQILLDWSFSFCGRWMKH